VERTARYRMTTFGVRELEQSHRPWVKQLLETEWGGSTVVSRGRVHNAAQLPGYIALASDRPVGLATYRIDGDACELVTLNSLEEGSGIGSALVSAVKKVATSAGCRRLWLITTNDNMQALRFYQMRGFRLVALHRDALEKSRKLKPSIPLIGKDGIQLKDELELELDLQPLD
jgi:ribosomal protein S18 acetylase RimI-like enzyme